MKVVHRDLREGRIKLLVDSLEDLWHLDRLMAEGDCVEGDSLRTVKIDKREEKKHVQIGISVERVEFSKEENRLRILGKIIGGKPEEFIQLGRYHTIEVEKGTKLVIQKKEWKNYELQRLKDAEKDSKKPMLRIIALDDEKALTALVRGYGIDYGPEFYSEASKRDTKHQDKVQAYYEEIMAFISRHNEKFLIAGPGFTKDNLKKFIERKNAPLLSRINWESCSYAERSGINELFKGGIVERVIGEQRLEKEERAVNEFIMEVNKEGKATYGMQPVKNAIDAGAVKMLLVLDELLRKDNAVQRITEHAGKAGAEIMMVSSESNAGAKLKGLGGLAALLHYRMQG